MQQAIFFLNNDVCNRWTFCIYYICSMFSFVAFPDSSSSDPKVLRDFHTVAGLQDQAQLTLSKYIQTTYPSQPFRFGKLLLSIPTLKTISSNTIADLFFRKTIGRIPIERLLTDMFKSSDFWPIRLMSQWYLIIVCSPRWRFSARGLDRAGKTENKTPSLALVLRIIKGWETVQQIAIQISGISLYFLCLCNLCVKYIYTEKDVCFLNSYDMMY